MMSTGTTDEVREFVLELGDELRVLAVALVRRAQFVERVHERLGDEHAAVRAEVTALVRQVVHLHAHSGALQIVNIIVSLCLLVRTADGFDESGDTGSALDAGRLLDAAADVDRVGPHRRNRPRHVVAVEASREDHAL